MNVETKFIVTLILKMNKYIKSDIEQGISFLRVAVNNALSDLEEEREKEINFNNPVPLSLVIEEAANRGWEDDHDDDWTNGWEIDYTFRMIRPDMTEKNKCLLIWGSLFYGNTSLSMEYYE